MKAIIPTGGHGTRMRPLTFSTNKHFIPVANKPLIFYPIEAVAETGIQEVLITYNPGWLESVKSVLGDGSNWGLRFTYVLQDAPKGLPNVVQVCEEYLKGEPFVFHLGDNIFTEGIVDMYKFFLQEKPNALVAKVHHPENRRLGVPYFDKKGRVLKIIEKPKSPPHDFAMPGIYFADSTFFKSLKGKDKIQPSARGEYEIPDPFTWMIKHGYRVAVKEYVGKWLDPGKFDDWIDSNQYLLDRNLEGKIESKIGVNVKIEGRVRIGKKCKIRDSEIRGPVSIGNKVIISKSYIGPFTSIDDGCVVEESHIENSVLMKTVRISNVKKPINNSLIGTDSEVVDVNGPTDWLELFIGEKSRVKI